ncbi:MAG: metal-dependent hydrolase [Ignavibacteria bacterium]|nr:metal-dependent hydrolase [Ignavibacteria bacterium]
MKLQYLSHSAFLVTTNDGMRILIDPFLDNNPKSPVKSSDIQADYILVSHAHGDHLGDTVKIARRCGALTICVYELANILKNEGIETHAMHIGGSHIFPFGKVKFTIAHHGSKTEDGIHAGQPAGILLTIEGKTIYHAGDTGLFLDMKLIGEMNAIYAALLPIGDNFTMGIDDAVKASEFLNPNITIPMHYNTFPVIAADPQEFVDKLQKNNRECKILEIGEIIEI